ncbi:hypothetical protein SKA34_04765 [Photobacterium sp. SKA34]|nr:hypothetical protein SKA34_04765 [Photobacterium sp. SKA34]
MKNHTKCKNQLKGIITSIEVCTVYAEVTAEKGAVLMIKTSSVMVTKN